MTGVEYNQLKTAIHLYKRDPERFKSLYMDGRLKLAPDVMKVLYHHYMGGKSFSHLAYSNIGPNFEYDEDVRYISELFLADEYDFVVRYDPINGMVMPDGTCTEFCTNKVLSNNFDITVGSDFLLTTFRYVMKINKIDHTRLKYVFVDNGVNSEVLLDSDYNLVPGKEGVYNWPKDWETMLMEFFGCSY